MREGSIGMFDSGIGGLTVLQRVSKALPHEQIIYFGDTARSPYGGKSQETIIRYSIENTIFLLEKKIKLLIIPCNTATALALDKLKQLFNIPILGVIEPGAEKAVEVTARGRIAVLGTKGTIASGVYQQQILKRLPTAEVSSIACPLFVPLVEEHFIHHPAAKLIVKEYLAPLKQKKVDTVLLGCTHYPLLRQLIEEELGAEVIVVDSAETCAEKAKELLSKFNLMSPLNEHTAHQYYASDDPEKFKYLGREFLGESIHHVSLCAPWNF